MSSRDLIGSALSKCRSYPAYQEAQRKLAGLEADLATAAGELKTLRAEASAKGRHQAVSDAAAKLLAGKSVEFGPLDTHIDQAERKAVVLKEAVRLQKEAVKAGLRSVRDEIGPLLRPHHEKMVSRLAAAIKEISEAAKAEEDLRHEMDRLDLGFPAMWPLGLAPCDELRTDIPYTPAVNWLAEAKEHGYRV